QLENHTGKSCRRFSCAAYSRRFGLVARYARMQMRDIHKTKDGWTGRFFLFVFLVAALVLPGPASGASKSSEGKCREVLVAQEKPTVDPPTPQNPEPPSNPPVSQARTETERYTLSHERYEKAVAYSRAGYTLYFLSAFIGFAVLLLVLRSGLAGRIRDFAQCQTENRFLQGLIFIPLLALILRLAELPVHIVW